VTSACLPPSYSTSKAVLKCSEHVAFKEYYLTSILKPSRANCILHKRSSKTVNQNDVLARLTMIDTIASNSLEHINKETNHSPITFTFACHSSWGRGDEGTTKSQDGTSSVVSRHRLVTKVP
jgi:hypothetical protein